MLVAELATPDVRLIVNVGASHLLELGGLDGVAVEKGAMFATARAGDACCVNIDDPRVAARPIPDGVRVIPYGRAEQAVAGLVLPNRREDWLAAIRYLLDEPAMLRRLAAGAGALAAQLNRPEPQRKLWAELLGVELHAAA